MRTVVLLYLNFAVNRKCNTSFVLKRLPYVKSCLPYIYIQVYQPIDISVVVFYIMNHLEVSEY